MGVNDCMRILKLFLYSVSFFLLLLTAVGLLLPSKVHISRAIDLPGQRKQDLMHRINDSTFRACWVLDAAGTLPSKWLSVSDSSWMLVMPNSNQNLYWVFHGRDGWVTLQARMDVELGWLPWQRFQSLLLDPRYGPGLEKSLNAFKDCLSATPVVYSLP